MTIKMKHSVMICMAGLFLVACGGETPAQAAAPGATAKLQSQLPALSGDDVWEMVEAESHLKFEAFYNGDFTGEFSSFQTVIKLNPDAPETGEIHAIIDLSSVSAKDDDVKANLPAEEWFHTSDHPYARYSSSDISSLGGGNYKAAGELTLKGITQPVDLTFSLNVTGDTATASGGVDILRTDFNVGTGSDFTSEDWVKFPVKVMVYIKATR